jgi:hypothetical protein
VCGGRGRTIRARHRVQPRWCWGKRMSKVDCFPAVFLTTGPLARYNVGMGYPHPIPWCAPGVPGSAPAGMRGAVPGEAHARGSHQVGQGQRGIADTARSQGAAHFRPCPFVDQVARGVTAREAAARPMPRSPTLPSVTDSTPDGVAGGTTTVCLRLYPDQAGKGTATTHAITWCVCVWIVLQSSPVGSV